MRTPSVRRRVTIAGVAVLAVLVLALGTFVYATLRVQLDETLAEVLDSRLEVVRELGATMTPAELAARLQELGVPAQVTTANGAGFEAQPATTRFQGGPPAVGPLASHERVAASIVLDDGTNVEVYATRTGVEATLRRVLVLLVIGSTVAMTAAALLFGRATDVAMAPLEQVVAAAGRTAAGRTDERLDPDDPTSEVGRLAVAYDRMLDVLEAAVDRAEQNEERSRRFLADAAHELRTPITSLRASVESLLREDRPEQRDELMMHLVRETGRARGVLESLLHLAHLDEGVAPVRASCNLSAVATEEVERAASVAPSLVIEIDAAATCTTAEVDERGVRNALANLLDNARRHARTRISVAVTRQQDVVEIAVSDDGPGLPAEAREFAFERFSSLDGRGGSGLGLPVARSIARNHGGELAYDGTAFRLWLPVAAPELMD